jgi:outer membrane protein
MRNLFIKVLALGFLFTGALQAQKMAHVNVDSLLGMMPESQDAQKKIDAKLKELETYLATLQTKAKEAYDYYQKNVETMPELERKDKYEELQNMDQRIQSSQATAQQTYQAYQMSMQKPISEKINKAIEMVAKENGYKYIFTKNEGLILYADPSDDITMLIKKKLDSMPPAKLPDSGTGGGTTTPNTNNKPGGGGGTTKPKPAGGK